MNRYDLIIFDVDGTLLDTSEGLIAAVEYTIEKCGLHKLDIEVIKQFIGPPIRESFQKVYQLDDTKAKEITDIFRIRYKDYDLLKAKPYPDIYRVFETVNRLNMKSSIATYKRQDYALNIIEHFGFNKYTDIIYGADEDNKLKKKDIIELCIRAAGVNNYGRVLMIGDSDNDYIGAKTLGIDFLGVTYGFGFKSKEEIFQIGGSYAASGSNEIIDFLQKGY